MHRHNNRIRRAAAWLLLLAAASGVWADTQSAPSNTETRKLCYCGCDATAGTAMCKHMCELAKYGNRWWATSCQKKENKENSVPAVASPQQQHAPSSRRNGVQEAGN